MNVYIDKVKKLYEIGQIRNRITMLEINNFRRFSPNFQINFSFPLTVIVGKNGSGKSTIMKMIKVTDTRRNPFDYFFETAIEDAELNGSQFGYVLDRVKHSYLRERANQWKQSVNGNITEKFTLLTLEPKTYVGAFDKNFEFDNIGKRTEREKQVVYAIKQSKKFVQNAMEKSQKKIVISLSEPIIKEINYIVQKNYQGVQIVKHKYFSGTWGITVIFKESNNTYSEYNSGSGEFTTVMLVQQLSCAAQGDVILIDEPEISLHPGAQIRLRDYILKMILSKKLQVIISTHSPIMLEELPKDAIKCFSATQDGTLYVKENIPYLEAFFELEFNNSVQNTIIVEDVLAMNIVRAILTQEGLAHMLNVDHTSGGADNIKKLLISAFSKVGAMQYHVIFDGDQNKAEVPRLSAIPEKEKTLEFLKKAFKTITGMESKSVVWGVDANSRNGRFDYEQEKLLISKYIDFFSSNVYFLPKLIPEDIIWDTDYAQQVFSGLKISDIQESITSKEKFFVLSNMTAVPVSSLYDLFISKFIMGQNDDYVQIKQMLLRLM